MTQTNSEPPPLDPSEPRDSVIAAGRERLLAHGIDCLRSQLNASVLSRESPVSRDTAYRVFRGDEAASSVTDAIIAAVAEAANDTAWGGYDDVVAEVLSSMAASIQRGDDPAATMQETMKTVFDAQFRSAGHPVGWILQACAIVGSEAWEGQPPAAGTTGVARRVLASRRAFYHGVADSLVPYMTVAMSELGRRPRQGVDPREINGLWQALLDGCVLRRFIDPDALPSDMVAEAMYMLWLAFTEKGPADDPRKPEDERGLALFDRLVLAAGELWQDRGDINVDEVAKHADVSEEAATLLFPQLGDLADSYVRSRVVGGGFIDLGPIPDPVEARRHMPGFVALLRRYRDLADSVPHAIVVTRDQLPSRSKPFVDDFAHNESRLIDALDITARPEQFVRDVLNFAGQGTPGWSSVTALLRTIGTDVE